MATLKYIIFSLFVLFVTCITAEPLNTKLFEPESKIVDDLAKAVSNCLSIADSTTGKQPLLVLEILINFVNPFVTSVKNRL